MMHTDPVSASPHKPDPILAELWEIKRQINQEAGPDATFDMVFADNVLEHLPDPLTVFREIARVFKSGGVFLFKTPNKPHSMSTIARLTPHRFHRFVNRLRDRAEADTFPTRYRANTYSDVQRLAAASGFTVEWLDRIEGRPEDLRRTWPTDLLGVTYERMVNSWDGLALFRVLRVGELRKGRGGRGKAKGVKIQIAPFKTPRQNEPSRGKIMNALANTTRFCLISA